jgi:hypothetical protein
MYLVFFIYLLLLGSRSVVLIEASGLFRKRRAPCRQSENSGVQSRHSTLSFQGTLPSLSLSLSSLKSCRDYLARTAQKKPLRD